MGQGREGLKRVLCETFCVTQKLRLIGLRRSLCVTNGFGLRVHGGPSVAIMGLERFL